MRLKLLLILLATAISGALSGYFVYGVGDNQSVNWGLLYGPGIFYGLAMSVAFRRLYRTDFIKLLAWTALSVISWYAAIQVFFMVSSSLSILTYPLVGALGAFMLELGFTLLIHRLSQRQLLLTPLAGAVLGLAMYGILFIGGSDAVFGPLMIAFFVWQLGISLTLTAETSAP